MWDDQLKNACTQTLLKWNEEKEFIRYWCRFNFVGKVYSLFINIEGNKGKSSKDNETIKLVLRFFFFTS